MASFRHLNLNEKLLELLKTNNIKSPTPIQVQAIPVALEGKNIIGQARTGTGKTLAFLLPVLEMFIQGRLGGNRGSVLILSPTRELVIQTEKVLKTFISGSSLKIASLYGGQKLNEQKKMLENKFDILNCAPGRLIDFANSDLIDLHNVKIAIIDEGDRLLELGFYEDMKYVLSQVPLTAQRMMFSATYSEKLIDLARQHILQAEHIFMNDLNDKECTITYYSYLIEEANRFLSLVHLLEKKWIGQVLVFVKGRIEVEEVSKSLKMKGFKADSFHADMDTVERDSSLRRFKNHIIQILVCSDLAARGLDIQGVQTVINYHMTDSQDLYLHRTGRTGRAFLKGFAYTLVTEAEEKQLQNFHHDRVSVKLNTYNSKEVESENIFVQKGNKYYKTIVFNMGKKDRLSPGNFVGLLTNEIKVPVEDIGNINVYLDKTEIELPAGFASKAVEEIKLLKGKKVTCTFKESESKKYKTREIATRTQASTKYNKRIKENKPKADEPVVAAKPEYKGKKAKPYSKKPDYHTRSNDSAKPISDSKSKPYDKEKKSKFEKPKYPVKTGDKPKGHKPDYKKPDNKKNKKPF